MSKDKDNTTIDNKGVERPITGVLDNTTVLRQQALARRQKSNITGAMGPVTGFEKYIPKGFQGQFVNPSKDLATRMYDRGYEFVKDENGNQVYLTANTDVGAETHRFPLMMAPDEVVADERAITKRENDEAANAISPSLQLTEKQLNNPFFADVGLSKEHIKF